VGVVGDNPGVRRLQMQFAFPVLHAVPLQLGGTRFVLPENFHECTWAKPKRRSRGFGVAILRRHDVKDMGDEQRKLRIARLDMPVATREFHFDCRGLLADVQGECHLHAVEGVNFVLFCTPTF